MPSDSLWLRIFRASLWALPRAFRNRHQKQLEAAFARELATTRAAGPLAVWRYATSAAVDSLTRGIYERRRVFIANWKQRATVETLARDVGTAARSLFLRSPSFTATAVLTLALGIGANTAVFSVLDAVLLRPLPVPAADRLTHLAWEGDEYLQANVSALKFAHWHDHTGSFEAVATWRRTTVALEWGEETQAATVLHATSALLDVLGYAPFRGRSFVAREASDESSVALISRELWLTRLAGREDISGTDLRVDGRSYTVLGVLPADFQFPYEEGVIDLILPLAVTPDPENVAEDWPVIARLRTGVSLDQARTEVVSLNPGFRSSHPNQVYEGDRGMTVATYGELYVRDGSRPIWLLMGATAFILLIACSNIASLFLARGEQRRSQMALRSALGAGRPRIVGLVFAESALIASIAAIAGLLMASALVGLLVDLAPTRLPGLADVRVDVRVLFFTLVAAAGTTLLFGTIAAIPATRTDVGDLLRGTGRILASGGRGRRGLVVGQAALSTVLLIGAGLLVSTLFSLSRVDPGFESDRLFAIKIPAKPDSYQTSEQFAALQAAVLLRTQSLPRLRSLAGASNVPLERGLNTPISTERSPSPTTVEWRAVSPGYFETLEIEVLEGRVVARTDRPGGIPVAVVNEAFARSLFPGEAALGRRVTIGRDRPGQPDPTVVEIVGVVGDVHEISLRAGPRRTIYVPQAQAPDHLSLLRGSMPVFLARLNGSENSDPMFATEFGRILTSVDPSLPYPDITPVRSILAASLARERFWALLLTTLALLALLLTSVGVYGVQTYAVRRRRHEIGLRLALGARAQRVGRMVVQQGLAPVILGTALGIAMAAGLVRLIRSYLWGVEPSDPTAYLLAVSILVTVALIASWIPARIATRLDPIETLRGE